MFDYSTLHWTSFLVAAFLLDISPGPDLAFILAQTLRGGRRAGFAALAGAWIGAFCHTTLAALGLSALLASSVVAFSIVKWVGAAYLVWLGVSAFLTKPSPAVNSEQRPTRSAGSVFRQGVIVSLTNPKMAIFFLAFLPQFVVPGAGPAAAQLMLHGLLIIAIAALIEPLVVLAADALVGRLRGDGRLAVWLERSFGTLMIGLGLRLAMEKL
jgi:threonine/homoserine/homoserine lactone efflux protein